MDNTPELISGMDKILNLLKKLDLDNAKLKKENKELKEENEELKEFKQNSEKAFSEHNECLKYRFKQNKKLQADNIKLAVENDELKQQNRGLTILKQEAEQRSFCYEADININR